MNKRISKKLKAMATVRDFTVQEAWDKVAEFLATEHPPEGAPCYFVDKNSAYDSNSGKLNLHPACEGPVLNSTKTWNELIAPKPVKKEIEYPLWEHKIEPEEITFYCQSCTGEITAQQDVDNDGECDRCIQGQNEMWAKEKAHEAYEYRDMKL
jgi:hypothetical protein